MPNLYDVFFFFFFFFFFLSNSVDPDETANNEPTHLDLCCLQKPILSHMAVKGFKMSVVSI